MRVLTIGHGTRPADELVAMLAAAGARTLVDVRRFPGSRRNPQFGREALTATLTEVGIAYRHSEPLGGRRSRERDEDRFACIATPGFRSYAAWMCRDEWRTALDQALAEPAPALMCAETPPSRCHRRLIADYLVSTGHDVLHLLAPHRFARHALSPFAEARSGTLYLCGEPVGEEARAPERSLQ